MAGWIEMRLGTEVGLSAGDIVLDDTYRYKYNTHTKPICNTPISPSKKNVIGGPSSRVLYWGHSTHNTAIHFCHIMTRAATHNLETLTFTFFVPLSNKKIIYCSTFLSIRAVPRSAAFWSNSMLTVVPALFGFYSRLFGFVRSAPTTMWIIYIGWNDVTYLWSQYDRHCRSTPSYCA